MAEPRCLASCSHDGSAMAGTGSDRYVWGRFWASSLESLGADVGILSETRLLTPASHAAACRGLLDGGYVALSHNSVRAAPAVADADLGPSASGVVLALKSKHPTGWYDAAYGPHGRGLAASVDLSASLELRVIALYGVSGSCLPGFTRRDAAVQQETDLNTFVRQQCHMALQRDALLVVAGDLNSIHDPALDVWQGVAAQRDNSLVSTLLDCGLMDTFRVRHPTTKAFTYFSPAGGASRLDAVLWRPPMSCEVPLLNAAVIWAWSRRIDHDPVVADLAHPVPQVSDPDAEEPNHLWKRLIERLYDPVLRARVQNRVEQHQPELHRIRCSLEAISEACGRNADGSCGHSGPQAVELLEGLLPWNPPCDPRTPALLDSLSAAHLRLMQILMSCLPQDEAAPASHSHGRASNCWDHVLHLLRELRQSLTFALQLEVWRAPFPSLLLALGHAWQRASEQTQKLQPQRQPDSPSGSFDPNDWDGFRSDSAAWAAARGFPDADWQGPALQHRTHHAATPWLTSLADVPVLPALTTPTSPEEGRALLQAAAEWKETARHLRAAVWRHRGQAQRTTRSQALRNYNLRLWCRLMRPPRRPQAVYAPARLRLEDGSSKVPISPAEVRQAAVQEWTPLHQGPSPGWSHPVLRCWTDGLGNARASPNILHIGAAPLGSRDLDLGEAYLQPGSLQAVRWVGHEISQVSRAEVLIQGWQLRQDQTGQWIAQRLGPCPGPCRLLIAVGNTPPGLWTPERWIHSQRHNLTSFFVVMSTQPLTCSDIVGPLSSSEREKLLSKGRSSRPGPSGWKVCYLRLFPDWAREYYWHSLDVQRGCGLVAAHSRQALQVNMAKPKGGWRPLTMLEESFKAVEGPVTKRLASMRRRLPPGCMYCPSNQAYEPGVNAAPLVLYLDAMTLEDARHHQRNICRIPADYEKFFNAVSLQGADAVLHSRAVPPCARRLLTAAFSDIQVSIQTRWGNSPPLTITRGLPQGSVSAPELSRAAQDPMLRLRENSPAAYHTHGGRRVAAAGFVDDTEHYGAGAADLPSILADLSLGSLGTGIGFAWTKCSAFATDWDQFVQHPGCPGMDARSIQGSGWDIWHGGLAQGVIARSLEHSEETLLGKTGTVWDRHTAAAQHLLDRILSVRQMLASGRYTWDEAATMYQLRVRGFLSYATLLGIPPSPALHEEDCAFQRLILGKLGTRCTAERVSLLACSRSGGLQLTSVLEAVISSAAQDVILLLSGDGLAGQVARDQLREAMWQPPLDAADDGRLIPRALHFLAQYGFYVTVNVDRTIARVLDCLARQRGVSPHQLLGAFHPGLAARAAAFSRVGYIANTLRMARHTLQRNQVPPQEWSRPATWAQVLEHSSLSPEEVASAWRDGSQHSKMDWLTEARIFGSPPRPCPPEDCPESAWEKPWTLGPRGNALVTILPSNIAGDQALYSDGSQAGACCSFSAQALSFGPEGQYWDHSSHASSQVRARLPSHFGFEAPGIHLAELIGMIAALRFRRAGHWNLLVCDRSALFSALQHAFPPRPSRWNCHPLESRLHAVLQHLHLSWHDPGPVMPSWRRHVEAHPHEWNQRRQLGTRLVWMCRLAHDADGLVGVDLKSHQTQDPCPHPVIVAGNASQDAGCRLAAAGAAPPDVLLPAGGTFAFLVREGRMITSPARAAIRKVLRQEAASQWVAKPVQGKAGRMGDLIFRPCLHPLLYSQLGIPSRWHTLRLPQDSGQVDLSGFQFRCLRAIGGSWTELLHSDASLRRQAAADAQRHDRSPRTCPLCLHSAGTPRHVIMRCSHMRPLVDHVRDLLEAELRLLVSPSQLFACAAEWRSGLQLPALPPASAMRWPLLCAWHLLVSNPAREALLNADHQGRSSAGVEMEGAFELGHRGILSRELGRCLLREWDAGMEEGLPEEYAFYRQVGLAEAEQRVRSTRAVKLQHPVQLTSLLLLGLRCIRAQYLQRVRAIAQLSSLANPVPADPDLEEQPQPPGNDRLLGWLQGAGACTVKELRWQLLPAASVVERVRQECGRSISLRGVSAAAIWNRQHCNKDSVNALSLLSWVFAGTAAEACAACRIALHVRGACPTWNRGISSRYRPTDLAIAFLCPDCLWILVGAIAASPRAPARPREAADLQTHLRSLARLCQPGAGSSAPTDSEPLSLRRVSRWTLRHIRRSPGISLQQLTEDFVQHLQQLRQEVDRDLCDRLVESAVQSMLRAERIQALNTGYSLRG
ncbi:unnamed protein product [Symbiodinium sp. CCMP2592]|nr:unnamed protein product [Symbiodinium sp. CCMP2592]